MGAASSGPASAPGGLRAARRTALVGLLGCLALPAEAEVRLTQLPDGSRLMSNSGSYRRSSAAPRARPEIDALIETHARRQRLDPKLVHAVVRVESSYNSAALSRKGAMGLMQLMPATARSLSVEDPYDPDENLRGGTTYLRRLIDRFGGDLELALASYNAGPEAVDRYRGLPPYIETHDYVDRVLQAFRGAGLSSPRPSPGRGRRTFVSRDASGRLVMTTSPPAVR